MTVPRASSRRPTAAPAPASPTPPAARTRTPCFMPVGTRGAVKYLSADDYDAPRRRDRARQHLPPDAAARAPRPSPASAGSARFAGWDGLTLTDSGGFQVFSLDPTVDDDGVTFRSTYDGSTHRLTPEAAVRHPGAARRRHPDGARRVPAAADAHPTSSSVAVERTAAWAARARAAHRRDDQALFGIVQGGVDVGSAPPRAPSAPVALGFDGYGIGGLSRRRDPRRDAARARRRHRSCLPADRPALPDGRGRPGVARRGGRPRRRPVRLRAADPPRPPRHGAHRHRARCTSRRPATPPRTSRWTPRAAAPVCARHSRGYLRHLFTVGEPTAARLVSLHNMPGRCALLDRVPGGDRRRHASTRSGATCWRSGGDSL